MEFDDWHIFEFEFLDEKLEKLEHFSVNGWLDFIGGK